MHGAKAAAPPHRGGTCHRSGSGASQPQKTGPCQLTVRMGCKGTLRNRMPGAHSKGVLCIQRGIERLALAPKSR